MIIRVHKSFRLLYLKLRLLENKFSKFLSDPNPLSFVIVVKLRFLFASSKHFPDDSEKSHIFQCGGNSFLVS